MRLRPGRLIPDDYVVSVERAGSTSFVDLTDCKVILVWRNIDTEIEKSVNSEDDPTRIEITDAENGEFTHTPDSTWSNPPNTRYSERIVVLPLVVDGEPEIYPSKIADEKQIIIEPY